MAEFVSIGTQVFIGDSHSGTDLATAGGNRNQLNQATSVELSISNETQDVTTLQDKWRNFIPGLNGATGTITALQDYDTDETDAILWKMVGEEKGVSIWPTGDGTVSGTNPFYRFNAIGTSFPISHTVGTVVTVTMSIQVTGQVVRIDSGNFPA